MTDFSPTPEQQKAIDLALTGQDLLIQAGAGTGKTSTLVFISEAMPERTGTYSAFNKAIVVEAGAALPSNVHAKTLHALAFRTEGVRLKHKLNRGRMKSHEIARKAGIQEITIKHSNGIKTFAAGWVAGQAMAAIRKFCQSDRNVPSEWDVPTPDAAKYDEVFGEIMDELKGRIAEYLPAMWADMIDVNGVLPCGHDVYLKSAVMKGLRVTTDFLMIDESQDLAKVTIQFVKQCRDAGVQIICVGDENQAIYGWNGATSIAPHMPDANRCQLSESFRFGPAVADIANTLLEQLGSDLRLIGSGGPSTVGPIDEPTAILSRTNALTVHAALDALDDDRDFHIVGGAADILSFCRAADDLQKGKGTHHPELACFTNWSDVETYSREDALGGDLALWVSLINKFGAAAIIHAMETMSTIDHADVVLSTAHKTKGLAFDKVQLAHDFKPRKDPKTGLVPPLSDEQLRLLYVAVTRAKSELDIEAVVDTISVPAPATCEVIEDDVAELVAPMLALEPAPVMAPDELSARRRSVFMNS